MTEKQIMELKLENNALKAENSALKLKNHFTQLFDNLFPDGRHTSLLEMIKDVKFSTSKRTGKISTIIFWKDAEKTIVKPMEGEAFSYEAGIEQAILKRAVGSRSQLRKAFKKYIPEAEPGIFEEVPEPVSGRYDWDGPHEDYYEPVYSGRNALDDSVIGGSDILAAAESVKESIVEDSLFFSPADLESVIRAHCGSVCKDVEIPYRVFWGPLHPIEHAVISQTIDGDYILSIKPRPITGGEYDEIANSRNLGNDDQ